MRDERHPLGRPRERHRLCRPGRPGLRLRMGLPPRACAARPRPDRRDALQPLDALRRPALGPAAVPLPAAVSGRMTRSRWALLALAATLGLAGSSGAGVPAPPTPGDGLPTWSPDGSVIVFLSS